jgi:hypothetical protein
MQRVVQAFNLRLDKRWDFVEIACNASIIEAASDVTDNFTAPSLPHFPAIFHWNFRWWLYHPQRLPNSVMGTCSVIQLAIDQVFYDIVASRDTGCDDYLLIILAFSIECGIR